MKHNAQGLNILLIDDHPAVRKGLGILLGTRSHRVGGEAGRQVDALAILESQFFDIALLDLTLKDGNGLDLLPELESRNIPALVYSMHEEPEIIEQAFRSGALGYVSKQEDTDILFAAIDKVALGKRYVSPCAAQCLAEASTAEQRLEQTLSDREMQVFALMGKGFGNTEIAARLDLSPRTIETYCTRMVSKFDLSCRSELRKLAILNS